VIRLDRGEGLWTATIARPDKANSLTAEMLETLAGFAEDVAREARALVITGEGKVFSAGADLDEARAGLATSPLWERLSAAIADAPCLTIAALNGTLAGGAFGMALACDLRIAVPEPQPSDPGRLTALVGPSRAKMILMAGQKIAAEEALAWGLVDRVVPRDGLDEAVAGLCADALGASPEHVGAIKAMIR